MKTTVLIPARMEATRFPGKPLVDLLGKPMIQWVYERAARSSADEVIVATDSRDIFERVNAFGGRAVMTRADHPNGSQRIAEVAANLDSDFIVNVQGDEPTIDPRAVDAVIALLAGSQQAAMSTLAEPLHERERIFNPNIVKVVFDAKQRALYFSRAPIPFIKHPQMSRIDWPAQQEGRHFRHVGIYGFRRDFLLAYVNHPPSPLEQLEGLEQLRALDMGATILVDISHFPSVGVDTPADLAKAAAFLVTQGEAQ